MRRIAQALLDRKLSGQRPIVILSGNSIEHGLLALAAMYTGVLYTPIAPAYSLQARDFDAALAAAAELGPPIDRFFDEVLVMAEDKQVRANRLRLLLDVRDAVGALGDLSQIPR